VIVLFSLKILQLSVRKTKEYFWILLWQTVAITSLVENSQRRNFHPQIRWLSKGEATPCQTMLHPLTITITVRLLPTARLSLAFLV
jgi:hypothetical protein